MKSKQIKNVLELETVIDKVILSNPDQVSELLKDIDNRMGFLLGQVVTPGEFTGDCVFTPSDALQILRYKLLEDEDSIERYTRR